MNENELSRVIIGAIIEVHRHLGPGLLEGVYEEALAQEFLNRAIPFEKQKLVPVVYKGVVLQSTLRVDFLVGGKVILELKAVEALEPVHEAQLLTYLKVTGCRLGLLVNFNVIKAIDGIRRQVNNL